MKALACALMVACGICAFAQNHQDPSFIGTTTKGQSGGGQTYKGNVRRLLELGIGYKPITNVRAIIYQTMEGTRVKQQIKVEIDRSGKLHQTILAPMQFIGTDLVDDGKWTSTYSPDDKTLIIQPSARQDQDDLPFRMKLIDQNYRLEFSGREKIAGREAVIVEANPKSGYLDKRCFAIDEKTGLLLRLQTCPSGTAPVVQFETKMVDFPDEFAEDTFKRPTLTGVNVKRYTRNKCYSPQSTEELTKALGFKPVVPDNLPHGFAIQQLQSSNNSNVPAVLVRITDGLAKGTVFQWRSPNRPSSAAPDGMAAAWTGKLTLLISGDLPARAKEAILKAFVQAARAEGASIVETGRSSWVLELPKSGNGFEMMSGREEFAALLMAIPLGLQY